MNILVIDDEQAILSLIKAGLEKDGHTVTTQTSPKEVSLKTMKFYDLILLDVMMPEIDGFTFMRDIRSITDVPILFLTAKTAEKDILFGLGLGADDYLMKPFRIAELRGRVNAHLRREKREHHAVLAIGEFRFDLSSRKLYVQEMVVPLTKGEYEISEFLAKNHGQVFTREQIYEAVFGFEAEGDSSTVATHIKNIRGKMAELSLNPIETTWGVGYSWQ